MQLAHYIDHTLLKATATEAAVKKLCDEAKNYHFYAVCINSCYVPFAKKELTGRAVKLAAVIGFPLGAMSTEAKVSETRYCMEHGVDEIDMVINIGWLKSGKYDKVREDISAVKNALGDHILKVIIETCYLTEEEKRIACGLALDAEADFVKTSTGFGTGGATLEDVQLMKDMVQDKMKIKASGGIKDKATALRYIESGVSRIGTSSGVAIVSKP